LAKSASKFLSPAFLLGKAPKYLNVSGARGMALDLLDNFFGFLSLFDSPGTYIMWIVIGLVFVPFYVKGVYTQLKNPQEYYMMSFEKKFWMGLIFITAWIVFGFANFMRFVPA
jgi:hypothetical protein